MFIPITKKSLGQHWLTDPESLQAICNSADLSSADTVLEIGPGMGNLTRLLAARAAKVVAVELDKKLADELSKQLSDRNVQIINQDILRFDLSGLPLDYKIVANIPYYLTSHLIRTISESLNPPQRAVLLVQKEVANRVSSKPGDMSLLSISAQFYWEVSVGRIIGSKLFTPPPKVDSQVLVLKRRSSELFPEVDVKTYFRIVKAGFAGRRKTLLNSLSAGLRLPKAEVADLLSTSRIDPKNRAQNLSLNDWHRIYKTAERSLKHNT